jgi:superfamily II DNA or RNA helicase/HKD family nuclease
MNFMWSESLLELLAARNFYEYLSYRQSIIIMSATPFKRGLYEQLITLSMEGQLSAVDEELIRRSSLRPAEAGDRLALHLGRILVRVIDKSEEKSRVDEGIALVRRLLDAMESDLTEGMELVAEKTILEAILERDPGGGPKAIERPLIPLLDTTLLTNARGEPRVGHQVATEIASAQRIDVIMAFIRRSGIRPLLDRMRQHVENGGRLRVLTTTYTGSTELAALEQLKDAGAEVRVSYDTTSTRLHAKAWLFHREGGFSTAYVGSSNLTHSAQVDGLEWNVRLSGARNPSVIEKVAAVFDSYWESGDFVPFDSQSFRERTRVIDIIAVWSITPTDLRLEPFQERLLEQVEVARTRGHHRNLLVSATGTGKTVMAAIDYTRLRKRMPRARLLFVAHREEILEKSRATYRHALRDPSFGELWFSGRRPNDWQSVFASIQTLHRNGLQHLESEHFDVVVVDEFHHAAARSYREVLEHLHPRELLGLTATPERADDLSVLDYFDGRIAAELRLWDAIEQHRLSPFQYFGIHDGTDLRRVPWRRGSGYDVDGLTNIYTANDSLAHLVLQRLGEHVDDMDSIKALGFCVGVEHARFMARVFNEAGVPSIAVWGNSPDVERRQALADLRDGIIRVLFSVDLFNEGVDIPDVDTLLLLRPTESPTLFLQQLGRGLRKSHDKKWCTVLDFVGLHRTEFRFDRRLRALLGGSRNHVEQQVKQGFPFLPSGCHMELDRQTADIVLQSIRKATPSQWQQKADELRELAKERPVGLADFIEVSGLDLEDIYQGTYSWSDLKQSAGLSVTPAGPQEEKLRRACGRLLHVDDLIRLEGWRNLLSHESAPVFEDSNDREARLARMLVSQLTSQVLGKDETLAEGLNLLWQHPQVCAELKELFDVLAERVNHLQLSPTKHELVPLVTHARYTRLEILAACDPEDRATVPLWQTGVRWLQKAKIDLFAFTLDKTKGQFSPTTRYRDYAISRELVHWESQSSTRAESETGLRYRNHSAMGSAVWLFARESVDERAFWFLGPAQYVTHEGEQPMAITWKLEQPLPGDLFQTFAAAVG